MCELSKKKKKEVRLESKLTAVSSKPVRSGMRHTLSALDHAMGYHTLHIIYYYFNQDKWLGSFELDPFRESLSNVLSIYPTMTGRLSREGESNWEVKCNDAGVRVIKTNVDTTLTEWLSSASGSDESLLISWEDMPHHPNIWSPFRIQINSFKEGGVAIGLSWSHMLADLTCAASFFKSWTETHRNIPITNPPFFTPFPSNVNHSNSNFFTSQCHTTMVSSSQTTSSTNMATATFKFSSSIIKQCLSKPHLKNVTPFELLSALFWTRIAHLKPSKNNETHSLSICTDLRSLIKPSLPIGYFGNALHFSTLSLNVEDMESGQIASSIHKHLKKLEDEEEIRSSIEWFQSQKFRGSPNCIYGNELTCVCMEQQESLLYESMFGNNEKPAHVSCRVGNVNGKGLIMVMPSEEGGLARTVIVMLPEDELAKLSNDRAILQLEPTMILSGSLPVV